MTHFNKFLWIPECSLWNSLKHSSCLYEQFNWKSESILQHYFVHNDGREGIEIFLLLSHGTLTRSTWSPWYLVAYQNKSKSESFRPTSTHCLESCIVLMTMQMQTAALWCANLSSSNPCMAFLHTTLQSLHEGHHKRIH